MLGSVTGGPAGQPMNVSVFILPSAPSLDILSPMNGTYLTNISLYLNYQVTGADNLWYNLDNTANVSVTSPLYFNTTQGSHILYLYANNSGGVAKKNVSFHVNTTLLVINYSAYPFDGDSSDFYRYTYEELQNLSPVRFERFNYGKIYFNGPINVLDDSNPTDGFVDIDHNVNISFNRIEINSTALPNFNKPATLSLYNLTFSNPRILRDGAVCPSSICTFENYSGGTLKTLKFNVTGFSVYSAEETPITPGPGPGGGGGGVIENVSMKLIVPPIISMKDSGKVDFKVRIKNTGTVTLNNISISGYMIGDLKQLGTPVTFDKVLPDISVTCAIVLLKEV
jgi:hypothetical protein